LVHRGVGKDGASTLAAIQADKVSQTPAQAKQFAADKRPAEGDLHFKHPYPVVQDNSEFDRDFVKDENADNGQYKAQMEYDRLRHLLTKQKQEVADALAKMKQEQKDVDDHNKLHVEQQKKAEETLAQKQAELDKLLAEDKAADLKATDEVKEHKEVVEKQQEKLEAIKEPKPEQKKEAEAEPTKAVVAQKAPETEQAAIKVAGTDEAKDGVLEAKKEMARCQKELDEATAQLKTLMKGLDRVKAHQQQMNDAYAKADAHETSVEKEEVTVHKKFDKESKEYKAAQKAYELQKERVERLKRELHAAGKLVKGHRDDEDADGGVYNVPEPKKSAASVLAASPLLALLATVAAW